MNDISIKAPQNSKYRNARLAFRILLILFWTQDTIWDFIVQIIKRLPLVGFLAEYVVPSAIFLAVFFSLPWILKHIRYWDFVFYGICFIVVMGSMVILEENSSYIQEQALRILGFSIPMYFIGLSYSHEDSKNDLFLCSLLSVVAIFAYQVYLLMLGRVLLSDNMNASYNILPSVLYLIYYAIDQKKKRYWAGGGVGIILVLLFGTRGPILIIFAFLIAEICVMIASSKFKKWMILCLSIAVIALWLVFSGDVLLKIAEFLSAQFEKFGFSTRIFDLFIEGDIATSKGRDLLADQVIGGILEKPLWGYGFMGDRTITGIYVHNIFLELWCHFGVVLGTLVVACIILIPIRSLWKNRTQPVFHMILLLTCMMFVKLMLSGSYPVEPYLYLLLGVSIGSIRRQRRLSKLCN